MARRLIELQNFKKDLANGLGDYRIRLTVKTNFLGSWRAIGMPKNDAY